MAVGNSEENNSDTKKGKVTIDIDSPRWDQSNFTGRLKHFAAITDMRKLLANQKQLDEAKHLVETYRLGSCSSNVTEDQLWKAKQLYDSAFHPDSGDKMNLFGKMSFQVPGGMAITGLLLQFYRTPAQVALMQWLNQSFNALVNYTNRNAAAETSKQEIVFAYATAVGTAVSVALGLNLYARRAPPVVARWVPFAAVASANIVNIPLTRQVELLEGVSVTSEDGTYLGKSQKCARKGISQVVLSRVAMAAPGMVILPIMMERLNKYKWFRTRSWMHLPFQTLGVGVFLTFMVPTACALFPQKSSMLVSHLESDLKSLIELKYGNSVKKVYFNKGL